MLLFIILYAGCIGLFFGSFFNVLIDRLPRGESVLFGRSHCDHCKKILRWYELLPVISFIWLKGKCFRCHSRLSWRYPLSELATAVFFMALAFFIHDLPLPVIVVTSIVSSVLWVILWTDLLFFTIPDSLLIIGTIPVVLYLLAQPIRQIGEHFLAASFVGGFFYFLWFITKEKGMGFGDVKLVLFLGMILGIERTITGMYVAFLTGALVGIILIVGGKKQLKSKIPFGPFLIFGAMAACFLPPITQWLLWK
jgi:prepilin signal peptidase PulO-like enzyme (type II secretory pathway)